jgi:hypothetical protein
METSKLDSMHRLLTRDPLNVGVSRFVLMQCLVAGSAFAAPAAPSTDVAVRQAESVKQQQQQQQAQKPAADAEDQPPETYPGENEDLGPQMLLKKKKKKPLFEFSADTMFTWTSNALSANTNPRKAGVVAETLSLTFAPEPFDLGPGKMGLRSGYRHLFWMYDAAKLGGARWPDSSKGTLNGLNFQMSTFFAGSNYSFDENWNASLGVDYNRILNDQRLDEGRLLTDPIGSEWSLGRMIDYSKWTEVYVEWNPNWGLSRNIALGDKVNLTLAYSGGYHFTATDAVPTYKDPDNGISNTGDKLDNNLTVSLTYTPTEKVMLQPNVRVSHYIYTQPQSVATSRRDRGIAPGLTVMWMPTSKVSLRWSFTADFRHSNDQTLSPNSKKLDASTGLSVSLKF